MPKVTFNPYSITVEVVEGANLIRAAMDAGVHVNASCGGEGACGKCRVVVEEGEVEAEGAESIGEDDWNVGYRLACRSRVVGDVTVRVPSESLLDRKTLMRRREGIALRPSPIDLQSLKQIGLYNPAFQKRFVKLHRPTAGDNLCDLGRLEKALAKQHDIHHITLDFHLTRKLARVMRENNFEITATLDFSRRRYRFPHLLNVEPGDTTGRHFAFAVDIGTTTVWVQLIDIAGGEIIGTAADYNEQINYGDDIIARIIYSQSERGLSRLQGAVAATVNHLMQRLLKRFALNKEDISHITLAGNTTMTHLFYGIEPKNIRLSPYVPAVCNVPLARARDMNLDMPPHVFMNCVSSVSSFVGGDIVAGVIASGIYKDPRLTLYIDIGTNGEIVIGNKQWLTCTACSAGPAFEGGGIQCGMRATSGAIERVSINPETFEPMILTIDMSKPKGVCGSGLINLIAALSGAGLLEANGKFREDCGTERIRMGENGREYALVYAKESHTGRDIAISETDIDNLMRAKAALFAGYVTLIESVGLTLQDIEQVILAGGFGNFINIEDAVAIGLLPDLPRSRFQFVGNGSLRGATLLALSRDLLEEERRVAGMMTNFDLSSTPGYMDRYVAALFLPHTELDYFPSVRERLRNNGSNGRGEAVQKKA
ncbi:MAG: ASKHA domain-containing protein [Desulfobacteraceae bacterium]|nr:ASKHA domain-containing protein [Desulfobacteraceae bacterium]